MDGGTGNQFLLLGTVTHHDNLIEELSVFLEHHRELGLVTHRDDLGHITDGGDFDARARLDVEREMTVRVGDGTVLGAAFNDARAHDRSDGIGDGSGDPDRLRRRGHAKKHEQH